MHSHKLSTVTEHHDHSHHHEEDDEVLFETIDPSIVFDASYPGQDTPEGYNAVKIVLDGSIKSSLQWDKQRLAAERCIEQGLRILWEVNLGLFSNLEMPIGNQSQFLSLCLCVEHFRDTLWKQFSANTIGLCIYRGSPDFATNFQWDEEQQSNLQGWLRDHFTNPQSLADEIGCRVSDFASINPQLLSSSKEGNTLLSMFCRDVAAEYLDLLADRLPDTLKCFILMDCSATSDALLMAQLTTKERFPRFIQGIKNATQDRYMWNDSIGTIGILTSSQNPALEVSAINIGVCLPSITQCHPSAWKELEVAFSILHHHSTPFRTIPESSLTTEWDGLDYLIVSSKNLTSQGRRKLQGFCAAGGTVVSIGDPIGLPQEKNNDIRSIF